MTPDPPNDVDGLGAAAAAWHDPVGRPAGTSAVPVTGEPSPEVAQQLRALLEADDSRLGEVYRGLQRNLTADEIAAELGVGTSNFVWNYNQTVRALLEGEVPSAPTVALGVARKFRALLKSKVSPEVRAYLQANLVELEFRANDEGARVVEVERLQEQTEEAEALNEVGVYVYALPHYLRYPFDPATGRTLMKVGRSDSDVILRFRNQTRTTALPEEPVLLRIYATGPGSNAEAESIFHRLLVAADHSRSVARAAGREWFVTSTRFTDEVARTLKLPIRVVNEGTVDDD
jgi:hypothetical protein